MKILWPNVFAFLFFVVALVLAIKLGPSILARLQEIGPGHRQEDQTLGLLTLGIICVSIVASVRLLTRK